MKGASDFASRAWRACAALAAALLAIALLGSEPAGLRAEAPWWREEGRIKQPLPPGTTIEIDTSSAASVAAARNLAGYMRLLEFPPEQAGQYEAACARAGQAFLGVFFDLITSQTHPVCLDRTPVTEDRALALCGVIWQRRDALFTLHGEGGREPPYTVAAVNGSRVTCRVGGKA